MTLAETAKSGTASWVKGLIFPGAAGVGLAVVLAFIGLLKGSPEAGDVLKLWGPALVLGLPALIMAGTFLDKMVDAQHSSVDAQQKVAVALTQLAERDDRERDRMLTETQYMAQRMDQTHTLVTHLGAQLSRIEIKLSSKET